MNLTSLLLSGRECGKSVQRNFIMIQSLDYIIIAVYLISILSIGIFYGFGVKEVKDYAIARKKCSTFFLTMTFLASSFGSGAVVGDVAKVATDGIIFTAAISGFLICCLIMSQFIAPYFDSRFNGMLSAGDIMTHFYGTTVGKITALLGLLTSSLYVGGQLTALGHIIGVFLAVGYKTVIILSALIVITYSALGGMRSVAVADVFKFSIIVIMVPLMTITMINQAGGVESLLNAIPSEKLTILDHSKFSEYGLMFLVSLTPFLWMYPPVIQRFLMARHPSQISVMYRVQLIVRVIFMLMIVCVAFSGVAIFPDVPAKDLVPHIVSTILPIGCRGLFIVCVLAASMSTSDSHINAASVLLAHNLFKFKNERIELAMLRFSTVIVGVFGIIIAAFDFEIIHLIMSAFSIWGAAVTIPLLAGVVKIRVSPLAFWVCFIGVITSFLATHAIIEKPGLAAPAITVITGLISFAFGKVYSDLLLARSNKQ